jgi:hypothetical protein
MRVVEDHREATLFELHLERLLEESGEAAPGVGILKSFGRECGDLVETLLEEGVDDLFLVSETAVGGADAHAGVVGRCR